MKKIILFFAILFAVTVSVNAQTQKHKGKKHEDMSLKGEKARLKEGIKSGEITKDEAKRIKKEAKDVQRAKRKANADGTINKRERAKIAKEDRQLDKTIRKTKHNKKDRG